MVFLVHQALIEFTLLHQNTQFHVSHNYCAHDHDVFNISNNHRALTGNFLLWAQQCAVVQWHKKSNPIWKTFRLACRPNHTVWRCRCCCSIFWNTKALSLNHFLHIKQRVEVSTQAQSASFPCQVKAVWNTSMYFRLAQGSFSKIFVNINISLIAMLGLYICPSITPSWPRKNWCFIFTPLKMRLLTFIVPLK